MKNFPELEDENVFGGGTPLRITLADGYFFDMRPQLRLVVAVAVGKVQDFEWSP